MFNRIKEYLLEDDFSLGAILLGLAFIAIVITIYQRHTYMMKDYSAAKWKALWIRLCFIMITSFVGVSLLVK